MPDKVMITSMRGRPNSSKGMRLAPAIRPYVSKRGMAPIKAKACAMGAPSFFKLSLPQSTMAMDSGKGLPSAQWRSMSNWAWTLPSRTAMALGILKGSKPWILRPVGSTAGVRKISPPGAGRMYLASKARSMAETSVSTAKWACGSTKARKTSKLE